MQNLNLYNYYDKSLADIHKDYLDSLKELKAGKEKKSVSGKLITAAVIFLLLIAGGVAAYYKFFIAEQLVVPRVATPNAPDMRSTEEKLGYVKVQIFEFTDKAVVNNPPQNDKYESAIAAKVRELAEAEERKQKERLTVYDQKKKIVDAVDKTVTKPVTPPKGNKPTPATNKPASYAVVFEDLNKTQYDFVTKAGELFNMKPELINSNPALSTVWRVYRVIETGNTVVGGKNVEFVNEFTNKEDAVGFAKDNKIQSIIRSEDVNTGTYSIRFCCSNLDNSKKIARSSNVLDKPIKIIREQ